MEREKEFFFARVYFGINDAWFWAPGHLHRLVPQQAPQLHYITGPGRGIKQETNTAECAWAGAELLPCPRGLAGPWHGAWHRITRGTESHRTEHPRDRRLSGLPLTLSLWLPARFQALLDPGAAPCYCSGAPPGRSVPGGSQRAGAGRVLPARSTNIDAALGAKKIKKTTNHKKKNNTQPPNTPRARPAGGGAVQPCQAEPS